MLDLITLFKSIQSPNIATGEDFSFSASRIPNYGQHRLGKDAHESPVLLISVAGDSRRIRPASIALENLVVRHDVHCRISRPDGAIEEGQFTVIQCTSNDKALHTYFLQIAGTLVELLGTQPLQQDVIREIDGLVELFRALTESPRKSVQGLWAELFLITRASKPLVLARAWHVTPGDIYDFSAADQRIEVKSSASRLRHHYFRLEQLYSPQGTKVLVASLLVERAGGGTSLAELIDQVRSRIGDEPALLLHVDRIVGLTLGESLHRALDERFDYELAKESLAFFESAAIPSVNPELPPGVSEVRFKSDLSGVSAIDPAQYKTAGGLFRAVLP
jgi:hypothetical protein